MPSGIVKNAIKYTKKGSIEFGYHKRGSDLVFSVKDTGIGIPNEKLTMIFDRFNRNDINDNKVYEGSGLGLSIAKAYAEMLGGKIWVESEEGVGSQFYFTIPYTTSKTEIAENQAVGLEIKSSNQHKKLKILIAEDEKNSDMLLSMILATISQEILHAENGNKAVELCRTNSDIDLIMMDIQMPGTNGYEATRQIREFNKDVIIIAQTAYAIAGDREKALAAGCDDYISKPIKKKVLIAKIEKLIGE